MGVFAADAALRTYVEPKKGSKYYNGNFTFMVIRLIYVCVEFTPSTCRLVLGYLEGYHKRFDDSRARSKSELPID